MQKYTLFMKGARIRKEIMGIDTKKGRFQIALESASIIYGR